MNKGHDADFWPRAVRFFNRAEEIFLVALLGAMVCISVVQIILRNIFSTGLLWADPVSKQLVLWAGLLGAVVATREGKHINIDLFSKTLGPVARSYVQAATNLFSTAICCILLYVSLRFVRGEYVAKSSILGLFPSWPLLIVFPLSFLLMASRFGLYGIKHLRQAAKGSAP